MWNLIKNVFRSLRRNKASVLGLTFLVFLSIGIFTILNSVSSNMGNEYARITTSGKLHDFTVSENYVIGNAKYDFTNNPEDSTYMGLSSDGEVVPWPTESGKDSSFLRTYQVSLNVNGQSGTLLNSFYDIHNTPDDPYYALLHPEISISNTVDLPYIASTSATRTSTYTKAEIDTQLNNDQGHDGTDDIRILTQAESDYVTELINVVSQTDTPMQTYLDENLSDKIKWRNFKSIDVTNSPDGKMYKMVQSNPDDEVDKVVLFGNNQQNNFATNEFNPMYGSGIDLKQVFGDKPGVDLIGTCLSYNAKLPDSFDAFKNDDKAKAFFVLLSRGDDVYDLRGADPDEPTDIYSDIYQLATDPDNASSEYENYLANYKNYFSLQNRGYRYTVNWNTLAPKSWTLRDWTAQYVVVSPKFLQRNGISPYQITNCNTFANDLNNRYNQNLQGDATLQYFNDFVKDHQKNVILNSLEVSMPFVVIGSGITADFTYPIFDIEHSNPNPTKECIIFGNSHAYNRMFDAYRGNFTENYLVGSFNAGVNRSQILATMNEEATTVMSWPKGIQACYMANDTANTLNASAFRVAFIPSLISKIRSIDVALTSFVIILSLFICAIVIQRYISNNRTQIGVMQANGVSKRKIAFSLAPYALLPALLGGFGGYLVGFFLQKPAVGLFSNYWMLPTPIASFNIWVLLAAILVPFLIFLTVSIISTFIQLREKTVNLMKNGSEFKGSFVARHIKEPFRSFGIMTKFRISTAFHSIWKLIILSIMVAMSISTLVFGINMINKFNYAETSTFASRNYTYAVDLYSPTDQGGQYIPVDADTYAETGFVNSTEASNWIPSVYFDGQSVWGDDQEQGDHSYRDIFGKATDESLGYEYYGIPKAYYNETYDIYDATSLSFGGIEKSFIVNNADGTTKVHAAALYPMMSDAVGENNDVMYLKNRSLTKTGLDFTVGAFGLVSNPWSIAVSLMPENNKNTADQRTAQIIQILGEATSWNDPANPYLRYYEQGYFQSKKVYFVQSAPIDDINQRVDPNCPYNYTLNKDKCIAALDILGTHIPLGNLVPDFMSFLNYVYTSNNFAIANTASNTVLDNDYSVLYNKVPLKSTDQPDETYTYLSGTNTKSNSKIRIVGLKDNSEFVNLTDAGGKKINNLLSDENTMQDVKAGFYPIIINAYAQHKYGLSVGDNIQFHIDNKANRITEEIMGGTDNTTQTFKVVGVNTTYQGEEYFTNQSLANYILGLRSKLTEALPNLANTCNLHNYYFNSEKADASLQELIDKQWWQEKYNIGNSSVYEDDQMSDLLDLSQSEKDANINPSKTYYDNGETVGKITPYGFNGVFTHKKNGSAVLNGGLSLYSPSGIYPGNDALDSDVVANILKQTANLEVANIITGIINLPPTGDEKTSIGQDIDNAFKAWQTATSDSDKEAKFKAMTDLTGRFVNKLTEIYGRTAVASLVNGAIDRDSTHVIFANLSNTISQVESTVLAIVSLMVIIIVMLITVMLIGDSKKLAAVLKALGYSDRENASSFLSIYVPVIAVGLLLSIPLSFALIFGFQAIIFSGAGILLTASVKWWSFLVGVCAICSVFTASGFWGYASLKRERLIDMMKG